MSISTASPRISKISRSPLGSQAPLIADELDLIDALFDLSGRELLEVGCGAARLARALLERHPDSRLTGLEVDARQHERNLQRPHPRLRLLLAGAEAMPLPDACFDGVLMLKSLHHVPPAVMDRALDEIARVLRPGGWLHVSEPVYDGALNEIVRLFNDEREVRIAAQQALDRALARPDSLWRAGEQRHFEMPVHFADFAAFERRMLHPSFADHHVDAALTERVRVAYAPHQRADGASFTRPMHLRVLWRR